MIAEPHLVRGKMRDDQRVKPFTLGSMFKLALAAAVLAATTLSPHAKPATSLLVAQKAPALPSSDANRNTKLADAAATTEDLIDSALNGKADNVAEKVAAMRKSLPTLRPLLSDGDVATLERQVSVMEQASAKGDILDPR